MDAKNEDIVSKFKLMDDDRQRFEAAVEAAKDRPLPADAKGGIGTLSEKTIHATLKNYFAPPEAQEIPCMGYVADVKTEDGIFEIQTRQFFRMKDKLSAFLSENRVCIVYPVKYRRTINWVDEESGELFEGKKWARRDLGYGIFEELYGIRDFLRHENLSICIMYLHSAEYKSLNGYGKNRKIRASRIDGVPTELFAEVNLCAPEDYLQFIPEKIRKAPSFTEKELVSNGVPKGAANFMTLILRELGVIRECGKAGRSKLYELTDLPL